VMQSWAVWCSAGLCACEDVSLLHGYGSVIMVLMQDIYRLKLQRMYLGSV
jgi:hypothetical protein